MKTTIEIVEDQVHHIVVQDLKESYMICRSYGGQDEEALADIAALKRVLEYYMVTSEAEAFFKEIDTHSKYYFDTMRNK